MKRSAGSVGGAVVNEQDVIDRIVEQNLGAYRAMPSRLQEDVSQEAQIASDYRGRLVYELLQNADDAMADAPTHADRVSFLVTDDALWIANTGRALSEEDVQGLCGLGASSKVDATGNRRASIGHKGLGFKSVLEITDEPAIYSHTHCFALGERNARPLVEDLWRTTGRGRVSDVPAMRFPVRLQTGDPRWTAYAHDGFNTAFCFPFREALTQTRRAELADLLLSLPLTSVLFLKHLESVDVVVDQQGRTEHRHWNVAREQQQQGAKWSAVRGLTESGVYRVTVTAEDQRACFLVAHNGDVEIGDHRIGISQPAWEGVGLTEVSVAACEPGSEDPPTAWRHLHVFLPTAEPSPYPILINGAFSTDLSRQRVRVTEQLGDYNAHLLRQAARLFREQLLPLLETFGADAVLRTLDRGIVDGNDGPAAALFHDALCSELRDVVLLPDESGGRLTLPESLLPPAILEEQGSAFREVLVSDAGSDGRRFPAPEFCAGRWARIAADHGAHELSASDSLSALAQLVDPARARSTKHSSGDFELDPVLELCSALWQRTASEERAALEDRARNEPLFPVQRNPDQTIERVALTDAPAFYPPRSARQQLFLEDLRFMSHPLCWGTLNSNERADRLADRMAIWTALFGIREFRFETVVQAAVRPALVLKPDQDALERRERLEDKRALAAICELAGRFARPDRPLRYQRLHSDRALFYLSRLPVPCRGADGELVWQPAYRVYFGVDWIGEDSVEHLADALPAEEDRPAFLFLAAPEEFQGLLGEASGDGADSEDDATGDEVAADEDADEAIETREQDRWIAFLSWIGVNRALRLIHFHDVEDDATGWLTTKNLSQPSGWAFRDLGASWTSFENAIRNALGTRGDPERVVPYFYDAHDLDQIGVLLDAAAGDKTSAVASALLSHLVRHWPWYSTLTDCELALVDKDKSPGQRTKPQRALAEELIAAGDNLWLHRLRHRSVCPTPLGPRKPELTWQPSAELDRRFGRRGRNAADLLPVLQMAEGLPAQATRTLAERLGVRGEPSPSTFDLGDARHLCEQLEQRYGNQPDALTAAALREVVKPVYRQMFELLSGRSSAEETGALSDAPLLAETADGHRFLPAREVLYAATPGMRERSGVSGLVPLFVLDAEPTATAPLRRLFSVRTLEDALEWVPSLGECPLDADELQTMREGLGELTAPLLARIRVERTNTTDATAVQDFIDRLEPVDSLSLSCRLDGQHLARPAQRPYYVRAATADASLQAFVVWSGSAVWPPAPETAQGLAMALADILGLNLVETFLAFIQSSHDQRLRLLDIAGAAGLLDEVGDELAKDLAVSDDGEGPAAPEPTAAKDEPAEQAAEPPGHKTEPAAPPVPLVSFDRLRIDGEPILIAGQQGQEHKAGKPRAHSNGQPGKPGRAAPGVDLSALDALGMRIAVAYEVRRLHRAGHHRASDAPADGGASVVVDVHSPEAIRRAEEESPVVKEVLLALERQGISRLYPGFDILTIADGDIDRLIELKSSAVDARVQAMSWNEWKTAGASTLRPRYWLYLVGNLRADLDGAHPFVRAINDPFGTLVAKEVQDEQVRRAVQLRVREFVQAEHQDLQVD